MHSCQSGTLAYFLYSFFVLAQATLGDKDVALPTELFLQFMK